MSTQVQIGVAHAITGIVDIYDKDTGLDCTNVLVQWTADQITYHDIETVPNIGSYSWVPTAAQVTTTYIRIRNPVDLVDLDGNPLWVDVGPYEFLYDWVGDGDSHMVTGASYMLNSILSASSKGKSLLYAHSGDTAVQVKAKIDVIFSGGGVAWATDGKYALSIGTNDVFAMISNPGQYLYDDNFETIMTQMKSDLEYVISQCKDYEIDFYWNSITPSLYGGTPTIIKMANAAMREFMIEQGVNLAYTSVDMCDMVNQDARMDYSGVYAVDEAHFSQEGYEYIGSKIPLATIPTRALYQGYDDGYKTDCITWKAGKRTGATITGNADYGTLHFANASDSFNSISIAFGAHNTDVLQITVTPYGDVASVDVYMRALRKNIPVNDYSIPWQKTSVLYGAAIPFYQYKLVAKSACDITHVKMEYAIL